MTAVPHGLHLSAQQLPARDLPADDLRLRTRLAAVLREFWHAMCAAHHARIPS